MKLSILIPTLPESKHFLDRLNEALGQHEDVEILTDDRGRKIPTGTKRNDLVKRASAPYYSFIDCDDVVFGYIPEVLNALEKNPDVITFQGYMTTDGAKRVDFVIKLGEGYELRAGKYYRWPNHLCVYKKELVQDIKFQDIWYGEDYAWSVEVKRKNVLQKEIHIPKHLYWYDFRTEKYV